MKATFSAIFLLITGMAIGQQASYFDAAQAYNRPLIEKNNGTYIRVSNYKVIGSPYLLGEKQMGNFYAPTETASNILLSYNTFNKELEFYTEKNSGKPLIKLPGLADSFKFKGYVGQRIAQELLFICGALIDAHRQKLLSIGVKRNPIQFV